MYRFYILLIKSYNSLKWLHLVYVSFKKKINQVILWKNLIFNKKQY